MGPKLFVIAHHGATGFGYGLTVAVKGCEVGLYEMYDVLMDGPGFGRRPEGQQGGRHREHVVKGVGPLEKLGNEGLFLGCVHEILHPYVNGLTTP